MQLEGKRPKMRQHQLNETTGRRPDSEKQASSSECSCFSAPLSGVCAAQNTLEEPGLWIQGLEQNKHETVPNRSEKLDREKIPYSCRFTTEPEGAGNKQSNRVGSHNFTHVPASLYIHMLHIHIHIKSTNTHLQIYVYIAIYLYM